MEEKGKGKQTLTIIEARSAVGASDPDGVVTDIRSSEIFNEDVVVLCVIVTSHRQRSSYCGARARRALGRLTKNGVPSRSLLYFIKIGWPNVVLVVSLPKSYSNSTLALGSRGPRTCAVRLSPRWPEGEV